MFSDIDEDFDAGEINNFIDDNPIDEEDVRFYRERNPLNVNDYPAFNGQTRDPLAAIYEDYELFYGGDLQPELYAPEHRNSVTFDKFEGFENSIKRFKNPKLILLKAKINCLMLSYLV